jgi:hypothetical protein
MSAQIYQNNLNNWEKYKKEAPPNTCHAPLTPKLHTSFTSPILYQAAEQAWGYAGKSLIISRNIMNAGLRSGLWSSLGGTGTVLKIQTAITRSRLFSIINLPFNSVSISAQAAKIKQSLGRSDNEGLGLGLLTLAILIGDSIDSLATVANAALDTFFSTTSPLISAIGLPLGFAINGMGSISRGIRLYHLEQARRGLENERFMKSGSIMKPEEIRSSVSTYLNGLGLNDPNQRIVLERHTTSGAANLLKELNDSLNQDAVFDEKRAAKVLETLHQINGSLRKEITVQTAYAVTNLLIFTSLCLMLASVTLELPFILLAVSWSARLILQVYQDFVQEALPKKALVHP